MLTCCLKKKINRAEPIPEEQNSYEKARTKTQEDDRSSNQELPLKNDISQEEEFQRSTSTTSGNRSTSLTSFYSIKSSRSVGDGDFYSVCSVESFKSV